MMDETTSSTRRVKGYGNKRPRLFGIMARCPYPFLVALPAVFVLLICLGLSREDLIEEDVANLWIPTGGRYKRDKDYAKAVGATLGEDMSTFAAMALSRHGENLFKEESLNEILARMKLIEQTPVTYNGNNYTWNDICLANGLSRETTYQFPCLRLSPMDLFQEARWYMTETQRATWYNEVAGTMTKALVIRYGIMQDMCISPSENTSCDHLYMLRTDAAYAMENGYPETYVGSPTGLLFDMFELPLSDSCRICIDEGIDTKMQQLQEDYVVPAFTILTQQLRRFLFELEEEDDIRLETLRQVEALIQSTASIATKTTRQDVEDFYMYYTIRKLYAEGAPQFQAMYLELMSPNYRKILCSNSDVVCPPEDISLEEARQALLDHTDNMFSSVVTFGAPFPFWGAPDGTGDLFAGPYPVGGSGINMSAPLDSLAKYLDLDNRGQGSAWKPLFYDVQKQNGFVDPLGFDSSWETMVKTNPIYAWFMAEYEDMMGHCANGILKGTNTSDLTIDVVTAEIMKQYSPEVCTKFNDPFEVDGTRTRQHFARMWYNLLVNSPYVLDIKQGESDPYTWTSGLGCGYEFGDSRFAYTGQSEAAILQNASTYLYNIDEGVEIGVIDRTALIGDTYPPVEETSRDNPLEHVGLLQSIYATQNAEGIVERVRHNNRPGGPLNITIADATEILRLFKISFEDLWSHGWDDDEYGNVQFVAYFDDAEVSGTIGRVLNEVTLSSGLLTAISIFVIAVFSVIFLASSNPVESKVGVTLVGVLLVILAFFASVGLGVLIGIKINLTIAWTLPFVILGLGVDNLYIILLSLQKQRDYSDNSFFLGMKEVVIPITMTSLVITSMFAMMNINDIPSVYLTAQVACMSMAMLYLAVIFCFPAYCYMDMKRQKDCYRDVFVCSKVANIREQTNDKRHYLERLLYDRFYQPLFLGESYVRIICHSLIWAIGAALLGVGLYGISVTTVGLGLQDFLPADHQGSLWAEAHSEVLGSWAIKLNWPALDYSDPSTQMKMIQQFENVASTPHVVEIDTRMLWIAEMAVWTTRQCDYNMEIRPLEERKCGADQVYYDGSTCSGTWKQNVYGLRKKYSSDGEQCQPHDGGVCLSTLEMHPYDLADLGINPSIEPLYSNETWCPVFEGWTQDKMAFCTRKWYEIMNKVGGLVVDESLECEGEFCEEYMVKVPIPYSSGPAMTTSAVVSHEMTLEMMQDTRQFCDKDPEIHCWMSGAPYDFWSQYQGIQNNLVEISAAAIFTGFGISFLFLTGKLMHEGHHGTLKILAGSLTGSFLVAANCFFSLVVVVGLSSLAGVSLTAFSIMSFVLSVGFTVEYSVHIITRWLRSDRQDAVERVEQTMSFLMLPTFMSFSSSTLGVICLAFTDFEFNTRFFFRPLIIVMFVCYFFGCYFLPVVLTWCDFDFVRLGHKEMGGIDYDTGSPSSKLKGSGESESEEETSGVDLNDMLRRMDPFPSHPASNTCLTSAAELAEEHASSLEFLPCIGLQECGHGVAANRHKSYEQVESQREENSVVSERREVTEEKILSGAINESNSLEYNHSFPSVEDSSQSQRTISTIPTVSTVPVSNTRASLAQRLPLDRPSLVGGMYEMRMQGEELQRNNGGGSLVDIASTESVSGSSVFDGLETASHDQEFHDDIAMAVSLPSNATSKSFFSGENKNLLGPMPLSPDSEGTSIHASQQSTAVGGIVAGRRITGGHFEDTWTGSQTSSPAFNIDLDIQKSQSSTTSPRTKHRKFSFTSSPSSIKSCVSDVKTGSTDDVWNMALLNAESRHEAEARGVGGYDMGHVFAMLDESPSSPCDPDGNQNRAVVTGETGQVLSVHAARTMDSSANDGNTIKF